MTVAAPYRTVHCSVCGDEGHNRRSCPGPVRFPRLSGTPHVPPACRGHRGDVIVLSTENEIRSDGYCFLWPCNPLNEFQNFDEFNIVHNVWLKLAKEMLALGR